MVCAEHGSIRVLILLLLTGIHLTLGHTSGVSAAARDGQPVAESGSLSSSVCARRWRRLQLITPYQTPFRNLQCLICLLPWQRLLLALSISELPGPAPSFSYHQQPGGLSRGTPVSSHWPQRRDRGWWGCLGRDRAWGTHCSPSPAASFAWGWWMNVAKFSL